MNRDAARLTELQKRILHELERDGRLSFRELGKRLGFSAPTIAGNLHDLELSGIIQKFTLQLDFRKLGFMLRAIVRLSTGSPDCERSIGSELSEIPQVIRYYRVAGLYDYHIEVAALSLPDLDDALARLGSFGSVETSIVMDTWEDTSRYLPTIKV